MSEGTFAHVRLKSLCRNGWFPLADLDIYWSHMPRRCLFSWRSAYWRTLETLVLTNIHRCEAGLSHCCAYMMCNTRNGPLCCLWAKKAQINLAIIWEPSLAAESMDTLTLRTLDKILSKNILVLFFPERFDISCKLSPMETVCMKCQILFSGNVRKKSPVIQESGKG